jgi:hypothetical protein
MCDKLLRVMVMYVALVLACHWCGRPYRAGPFALFCYVAFVRYSEGRVLVM